MRRPAAALLLAAGLSAGCTTPAPPAPQPTASPSETVARPFTVTTTEIPTTYDPAAAVTGADAIVALNTFSRLMVVHPDGADLKPDLATDCLYTSPTVYECELPEGLTFHNGHALTSSDVEFSIERAYRLSVPGSSTSLLDSLARVEAVDDRTVRFTLRWADTQFGYALATPAAGIVDEEIYDPDAVRPNTGQAIGSGPYKLVTMAEDGLVFELNEDYVGALTGVIPEIRLAFVPDSAAAEQAMAERAADVVWRSLAPAAIERLQLEVAQSEDGETAAAFQRFGMPPVRLQRLVWNPASAYRSDAALRSLVAVSLQADRSVTSLIPPQVAESVDAFPVGGQPEIPAPTGQRPRLTLAYSSRAPGQRDIATLVRDRLEETAGLSVQLVADSRDADLLLTDRSAWVNTAFGWLQPYTDAPLPGSAEKIATLTQQARETTDPATRLALLGEIQQQAAADLTVLPLSLDEGILFLGEGAWIQGQPFGPGYQLGLWSLRK